MAPVWLLCSYKLPREPTRLRLAVWRRLRRIGAVLFHDGLWVLPSDPEAREDFEWLAEEVEERGGTVLLWESRSFDAAQDTAVAERFRNEAEERYGALAEAAKQLSRVASRRTTSARSIEQIMHRLRTLERALRRDRGRDPVRSSGRAAAAAVIAGSIEAVRARSGAGHRTRRQYAMGD